MKRIARGMYRTISSNTKLPVPDEQLKRGVVEKLQNTEPVTSKQRTNVGVMSKAQEDAFEKEYETYIAEQKKLKVEREAAEQTEATLALAMAQQEKASNGARVEQRQMALNQLNLAKKTYDRINRLHKEGVVPTQKLDEAYAQYKSAQDAYNMTASARYEDKLSANANVQRARGAISEVSSYLKENSIVAPIDGEITELTVDEGELVGAGYPIVTVADNTDAWVTFNMREDLLSKIKMNKELTVIIPALSNQKLKVKVNYISVLGNFATWRATKAKGDFDMKTFEVRAVPLEPNTDLRAGMSAITDWEKIK